jgi:hypothetical protein
MKSTTGMRRHPMKGSSQPEISWDTNYLKLFYSNIYVNRRKEMEKRITTVLKFNTLCNLMFGLLLLIVPGWMMSLFGVMLDQGGLYMARLAGSSFLGFAALTWLSQELQEDQLRKVILPTLLTWFAIGLLSLLYGQVLAVTNFLGWVTILLSAFFVGSYAYFLLRPGHRRHKNPVTK